MASDSPITDSHVKALVIIERVNSSLSVLGCLFIITSFLISKSFHRPINRLVFYASVGNLLTNIATIVSSSVLDNLNGFVCQGQAFLIQMFMAADVLWTLAMACNVYLTFYHKYDAARLKKVEKWYFLLCYGLPLVPAIVYIFVQTPGKGRIYGNAFLWCWITAEYDFLRIATFYGPVWLVILATFGIYIRAGREIYKKRRQLRKFSSSDVFSNDIMPVNPFAEGAMGAIHEKKDVSISFANYHPQVDVNALGRQLTAADRRKADAVKAQPQYTVSVSTSPSTATPATPATPANYRIGNMPPFPSIPKQPKKTKDEKNAAKAAKTEDEQLRRFQAIEANRAAWGYTKVAVLFFTAMLITWIPSSANRVYSVVHQGEISIPLTFASAFVLPLQGFWNCLIYTTTSLNACKELLGWMGVRKYNNGASSRRGADRRNTYNMDSIAMGRPTRLPSMGEEDKDDSETGSTAELASPVSAERRV